MILGLRKFIDNVVLLKGSSGGSGGGGSATATAEASAVFGATDHDVNFDAQEYANAVGVTVAEAEARFQAIDDYTGDAYVDIRRVQRDGIDFGATAQKAERIESYLSSAKKFDGEIYRGVSLGSVQAFLDRYGDVGSTFTEKSMNSWSSDRAVAQGFGQTKFSRPVSVVFNVQNRTGASIRNKSNYKNESEVLVGKNARYRVTKIETKSRLHFTGDYNETRLNVTLEQL